MPLMSSGFLIFLNIYKKGRCLGEVNKFLVYNARKRNVGGDLHGEAVELDWSSTPPVQRIVIAVDFSLSDKKLIQTAIAHATNPALSSNYFSIGCNSNNGVIQAESLNSIHYGNTRMYNRLLFQDEIINNYYYELLNYIIPTSNIYFITKPPIIESLTVPNYDLTAGYLTQNIDLNILRSSSFWTIEVWVYATSWGANDSNWIIDFNYSGNNTSFFSIGITTNITGISPSITYDGNGRPFIYYANDTIMQWKIKNNVVPLYQWVHLAYQKNSDTELQIFMNGNTLGTFTINANEWKFPSFSASGINNILIGGSVNNPSSTTKHWKGQMSQLKISLEKLKKNITQTR